MRAAWVMLVGLLAGCAAPAVEKTLPAPVPKPTPRRHAAAVFPQAMRGTWYAAEAGRLQQLTIAANALCLGGQTTPVYWVTTRSAGDNRILDTHGEPNPTRRRWGAARKTGAWLNVRGWYQATGSGSSYRLVNHRLQVAAGAKPTVVQTYFPTRQQAEGGSHEQEISTDDATIR